MDLTLIELFSHSRKLKKHCFDGGRISMPLYQETVTVGITEEMRTCVAAEREGCHHVRELATRCRRTHRESKKKENNYIRSHPQYCTNMKLQPWEPSTVM
jgi:hypothetical protein